QDFLPGGTLFTHLQCAPTGFLSRHKALFYGAQMFLGIRALHQFGVLHGDIKLDNFLLNAEGNVVVSDFGLAQLFNMDDAGGPAWKHAKAQGGDGFPLLWPHADNPHQTQEPRGIAYYGAPEATAGEKYSYGADLWSWAVCFFEILTGQMPYELSDAAGLRATAARYNEYAYPPVLDLNNSANRFVFLDEADQDFFGRVRSSATAC
ncbi:kinase-like domain-containing protein, partial [Mycena crocata]